MYEHHKTNDATTAETFSNYLKLFAGIVRAIYTLKSARFFTGNNEPSPSSIHSSK